GDKVRQLLGALGYPGYLVLVLIPVKILGVAAILSRVNVKVSDLAYAGMFYHLLLAFSAHINAGDYSGSFPAIIGFAALLVSFFTQNSARKKQSSYTLSQVVRS
ncbi:DoxX family protein, partial [Solirubrobacter sp. CPCC 204708]|nr:DoxX family protein [Solirubrobacter deserti]